jgi:HEAT repeat protein
MSIRRLALLAAVGVIAGVAGTSEAKKPRPPRQVGLVLQQQPAMVGGFGGKSPYYPQPTYAPTTSSGHTVMGDEQTLRGAGLKTDGDALLDFFRKRAAASAERSRIRELIGQLKEKKAEAREKATAELVSLGPIVLPELRRAAKDVDDQELTNRIKRCVDSIDGPHAQEIVGASLRLAARRGDDKTVAVLLQYLPSADNDAVLEQVRETVQQLAVRDGKLDPALTKALEDKASLRRAVAAEVLSNTGRPEPLPALRKLLKDRTPVVRLRVSLALGQRQEGEAVETLIALLTELPAEQARPAEEFLFELAGEQAPQVALGADGDSQKKSREAWEKWWKGTEGPKLLDAFRDRTLTEADRKKVVKLVDKLNDESYEVRERAFKALAGMNGNVLPLLKQYLTDPRPEVKGRVERCVSQIKTREEKTPPLSPVSARLVALRKPAGAAEVLLNYLAVNDEDAVSEEVLNALAAVATRKGKVEPVLLEGLKDEQARRRSAAGAALVQAGLVEHLDACRKLLKDKDAGVRLNVGLALASAKERQAVPVLIDLLADLPPDGGARAMDYLRLMAGDASPNEELGSTPKDKEKCRDAWAAWWKENGAKTPLVSVKRGFVHARMGYSLLLLPDMGQMVELDRNHKPRVTITGLSNAYDAQALPGERYLIAEWGMSRVTERTAQNRIVWTKQVNAPIGCQRLRNGHTFITTPYNVLEVDRHGKEVANIRPPQGQFYAAYKMKNGNIVCTTNYGLCYTLDAKGKQLSSFRLNGGIQYGGLQGLDNGHILISHTWNAKVYEYDSKGKVVWEVTVNQPTSAYRLPNGNTLVGTQYPGKIIEYDRKGVQRWEYQPQQYTRVTRVRSR